LKTDTKSTWSSAPEPICWAKSGRCLIGKRIDLALVGVLWGGLILFAGRLPACKARECRFLAGDGITTSSLRGTEERVIGIVEDLLGRLSLALAATLFALAASLLALFARISRTDRALPLGLSLSWLAARR